jgi:hypothetical protein
VGDLLRDIETALDTVLDEREKQLQQQVSALLPSPPLLLPSSPLCLCLSFLLETRQTGQKRTELVFPPRNSTEILLISH